MDCYSVFAAKASKYKNPINDVGVTKVYGVDDPETLQIGELTFAKEHSMTPQALIDELHGTEKFIFRKLYAGGFAKKLYRYGLAAEKMRLTLVLNLSALHHKARIIYCVWAVRAFIRCIMMVFWLISGLQEKHMAIVQLMNLRYHKMLQKS